MKIPSLSQMQKLISDKRAARLELALDKTALKIYNMLVEGVDQITMADLYQSIPEMRDPIIAFQVQDELKLSGYLKNNDGVVYKYELNE